MASTFVRLPKLSGSFSQAGLKTKGVISWVTINSSTWTALPVTPLAGRNAMSIQNRSGQDIKLIYDTSLTDYLTLSDQGERSYDITESIQIFAKCTSGIAVVTVEELS